MFFGERQANEGSYGFGYQGAADDLYGDSADLTGEEPEETYDEEDYVQLIECLENVTEVGPKNQHFIVEVIRNLAEFIIFAE